MRRYECGLLSVERKVTGQAADLVFILLESQKKWGGPGREKTQVGSEGTL